MLSEKPISYFDIKQEVDETFLRVEKLSTVLWLPFCFIFSDFSRDNTNYFMRIREFVMEYFAYEVDLYQSWLILFFLTFLLLFVALTIFEGIIEVIYRIKPEWW